MVNKHREEKRKASRISISLPVKYKIIGKKGGRRGHAFCRDIGGLGFGLIVNEPLKVNDQLRISISRKDNNKTMFINCRVAWCVKDGPALFKMGAEISKVEDPLTFIEFIGDMMLSLRKSSITACRKRRKR
jgi:hypothetical protein